MTEQSIGIISCGAAGSKMFTQFLYPEVSSKLLGNFHGHYRCPETAPERFTGFVYMFADPRDAVISFFERRERLHGNHGFRQERKDAGDKQWQASNREWVRNHLVNLECDPASVDASWSLEAYLENCSEDVFRFEEHFDNWRADNDRDVLFVRFESLWDREADLRRIFNRPGANLPTYTPRAANWKTYPPEVIDGLNLHYGRFANRLAGFPDISGRFNGQAIPPIGPNCSQE